MHLIPHTPGNPRRVVLSATMDLPAPPDEVFELLCPVREYDWIPPWRMGGGPWRLHVTGEMCVFPHVPVPLLVRLLQTSAGSDALTVCDRARETSKECAHEQD